MKKIIVVITKIVDGKETIDMVATGTRFDRTSTRYSADQLTEKMREKANNFIRNAKYRANWDTESVFDFLCEKGYKYSNIVL